MIRYFNLLFFVTFLLFSIHKAAAQTITTIESRCVNTGQVIVSGTVGAGGPYQLSVVSHPANYVPTAAHFTGNLPDTFAALFPGVYAFKIIDQSGTVFNYPNIIINGTYVLPGNNDYTPVSTPATNCSLPNGTIQGIMRNGRAPYSYTIINGPAQLGNTNNTGTFTGLPGGQYKIQVADSCQNVQTRDVTVTSSGSVSLAITAAPVRLVNCSTFLLERLTVIPAFPAGGRYEIINYDNTGTGTIRASGTSVPVSFILFSKTDVPRGRVVIKVYDTCGGTASFTPTRYTNYTTDSIIAGVINRIGCGSYSLDALTVQPALPAGSVVRLTNTRSGAVYNAPLPVNFNALETDITNGNIVVSILDSCGNLTSTDKIRIINNSWNISPDVKVYCSGAVLNSININGFVVQPVTVKIKALFTNEAGNPDSTTNQLVTSFPYTITGITGNPNPLTIRIEVTDSCGEVRRIILTHTFLLQSQSLLYKDCSIASVSLMPAGRFVLPVTYSVFPDTGIEPNNTGLFELPDGTYTFTAIDSCGKKSTFGPVQITRPWQLNPVEQVKTCSQTFISNSIIVPAKSIGAISVKQYSGGMPVTNASLLLNTKIFSSRYNRCVTCNSNSGTTERVTFDSTLSGETYTYIVTDSCGTNDTVSVVNDTIHSFHKAFSKTKCILGSDVYASWQFDLHPANNVLVDVFDGADSLLLGFNSGSLTNMSTHPNGQILLYDVPPGVYRIRYSFLNCPDLSYTDTVITTDYVQPKVSAVQSFTPCSTGVPVIISGMDGIGPYQYQLINSYPDNFTSAPQASAVFTLPVSQSTVTVRVLDACLNSVTRTLAVTRASPPVINTNPALLSTCSLPFSISLFTDSLYDGSVFEWRKLTGSGSGSSVIGNSAYLPLVYNSIADTGTYQVRVTVPGTCFDITNSFTLKNIIVTCNPGIAGNVFIDANGLTDFTVNGLGTDAGGTLKAILVNASDTVTAVSTVSANGVYSFPEVQAGAYTVIISTNSATINTPAPAVLLPAGWIHTGEHTGRVAGNDGAINGKLPGVVIDTVIVTELNFGIERIPVANDTVVSRVNPGGIITVPVPVLTGSDAEDGIYDGVSGINTIIIQSLPVNAFLYYNGALVAAGQVINNYQPSLFTIDPFDNISSTQFTFSEVDAAMQASQPDTVIILFTGLPVTVTSFTALPIEKNVTVNWKVEEQLSILNYTVEHSSDGYYFQKIGLVNAANTTSYSLLHTNPVNAVNYYRLKIIEQDGHFYYSKTVTARIAPAASVTVKPNPFKNTVEVVMSLQQVSQVKIVIYDAAGSNVYNGIFKGTVGSNLFVINNLYRLSKGIYVVKVLTDNIAWQQKLLKD